MMHLHNGARLVAAIWLVFTLFLPDGVYGGVKSFEPKQHGQSAKQRRRLRNHQEVVQLPQRRDRRHSSRTNSYKHDPEHYPKYLSGFYGYNDHEHEDSSTDEDEYATHFPTYSVTSLPAQEEEHHRDYYYGEEYYAAHQGDDYYQYNSKSQRHQHHTDEYLDYYHNYYDEHHPHDAETEHAEYHPETEESIVYTYTGENGKHKKGGKKSGARKHGGYSKSHHKSKGRKSTYYDQYAVEEEILHGDIHKETIHEAEEAPEYDNEYEQVHHEIHQGLLGPIPDTVHEQLHGLILEEAGETQVPVSDDEHHHYPYSTGGSGGPKGYHYHSEESSSCSKGKTGGNLRMGNRKRKRGQHNYYEVVEADSDIGCASKSKRSKGKYTTNRRSSKGSKAKVYYGYGMKYKSSTSRSEMGNETEPTSIPFGEMTPVPSAAGDFQPVMRPDSGDEAPASTDTDSGDGMAPVADPGVPGPDDGMAPVAGPDDEMAPVAAPDDVMAPVAAPAEDVVTDEPTVTPMENGTDEEVGARQHTIAQIRVEYLPFGILYDIPRDGTPTKEHFEDAADVTEQCIDNYFRRKYGPESTSIYLFGEIDQGPQTGISPSSGAFSDYGGSATFLGTAVIPKPESLDVSIGEALSGYELVSCIRLFRGLPPENVFSEVKSVRKVESSTTRASPARQSAGRSGSRFTIQRGIYMIAAFGMLGLLLAVGVRMWLGSRRKLAAVKSGVYFGGDDILLGDSHNAYLEEEEEER
ncbi:expressed unknown protein [Seminavis robusta]|uniref:Uncharacterized protein n=1 Tax=Seminavis robusta TaxID=568900 RepID=A0A9N8HFB5_9STRA|nr:expressed unknown protein [Seminavis robusta]|eukprot:Sro561_g166760.1 n/a (746) ;mRNA; f:7841-10268